ncbi:Uncharacterised protein [uncultured archaeon]|nr:Uncharacterised protein [uncultured archaeon]
MSTTLNSPGVQITVTDETAYTSATENTVPFILVATAEDKLNQSNVLAQYTTANTAGNIYLESSQRSLVADFGAPNFLTLEGSPINGSEQNEYGLMTAYSVLGITDEAYIMRAPIDLNSLDGSLTAPVGNPANAQMWLDTAETSWGLFQFDASTLDFTQISTTNTSGQGKLWVIDTTADTTGNISTLTSFLGAYCEPLDSIGKPGDYAVVPANASNPVWYKNSSGAWVLVGSVSWQNSVPTVTGSTGNPIATGNIVLNGSNVVFTAANVSTMVSAINAADITGVSASAISNRLALYVNSLAGNVVVTGNTSVLSNVGITAATYFAPAYEASSYVDVPQWNPSDATPEPTGSVWFNTTTPEEGANLVVETYSSTANAWTLNTVTLAANDADINEQLDSASGGINIPVGTLYLQYAPFGANAASVLWERVSGATEVTGTIANAAITANSTFYLNTAIAGESDFAGNVTVTITGNTASDLVSALNTASITGITAGIDSNYHVYIENTDGETFYLYDGISTPLASIGITTPKKVSNWVSPSYVVSDTAPASDPEDGTIWYYDDPTAVDILINTGSAWASYRTVTADARGYDLTLTDSNGPIVSASTPTAQNNGNALAYGDLWIDTADLSNLPCIYRYSSGNVWTEITNSDHTSVNGIVFSDARWSAYGNVDPGTGQLDNISTMLTVSPVVLDSDAPSYALYPRGTLLFNTRRSGMNVKQFETGYLTSGIYLDTWVTESGNDSDGVAYQGSQAQRHMVVKAMVSALENSSQLLDEFYNFNLMAAPGYPELMPTLVSINESRGETAFIVGDSPMTLAADSNDLNTWANNLNDAATDGKDGLVTNDDYLGVYYPSALTTDLGGNDIVVPSSHMALPVIINSDAVSYPWYAPAGAQRGVVSNVTSIGYIDEASGNYVTNSISQSLRDILYPAYVNPISNFTSGGIQVYGQKTRSGETTELSRINVARLVIYLRQELAAIGRNFVFEMNDSVTRAGIAAKIGDLLASVQANRGIYDYSVDCSLDNNTAAMIDANELQVDVAVAPTTSVEFIYIPLTLVGYGVLSSSTVTTS